ncbi:unnamed protein product [Eruca vesicaria subsp. sativa]|uniref:Uncharacterized protein n=1 Tax=Eruca vesicaria subsp. sativa TaxID=29727 RepID=A0ABC8LKZ5_ERUVS|nr:unnamed protein product [Eruca vesicaria subsp. sativa]
MFNMEELKSKYSQLEETVTRTFQAKFDKLKKDMVESLTAAIRDEVIRQKISSELDFNQDKGPRNEFEVEETQYEATIRNVLGNIDQYTTPRETSRTCAGISSTNNCGNKSPGVRTDIVVEATGRGSNSYQSHKSDRLDEVSQSKEGVTNASGPVIEVPSFSLGLTQEEVANVQHENNSNETANDGVGVTNLCRKIKRQRTIPPVLLADYHCPPILVTRARESQKRMFATGDATITLQKFEDRETKLNRHL